MPSLTYEYVYFGSSGAHTRQPRATNTYGGFTPIPGLNSSGSATLQTGTWFQVQTAVLAATQMVDDVTYSFAFVNVSGLNEGGRTSFDHTVPPPGGTVGTIPVKVLVVYLPQGDGNGNTSGAIIDAFDVTLGRLVDDNFVTVSVNGSNNPALTNSGNVDGYVDSTNNASIITANSSISLALEGMPGTQAGFDKWVNLANPTPAIIGLNLNVNQGETIYAFAFYQNITKSGKEFAKEDTDVLKRIGADIFGFDWTYAVDPAYLINEVQKLNTAIAALEIKISTAIRGNSFIKQDERPEVGKFNAAKTNKG